MHSLLVQAFLFAASSSRNGTPSGSPVGSPGGSSLMSSRMTQSDQRPPHSVLLEDLDRRPALIWQVPISSGTPAADTGDEKNAVQSSSLSFSPYWDVDPLGDDVVQQMTEEEEEPQQQATPPNNKNKLAWLSYQSMLSLCSDLVQELRQLVHDQVKKSSSSSSFPPVECQSVPIAVAIPEGLFLPLAVAAVHALNEPWGSAAATTTSTASTSPQPPQQQQDAAAAATTAMPPVATTTTTTSAVLVPLDPHTGDVRLRRVLEQARPALVLTASEKDTAHLRQLLLPQDQDHDTTMKNHAHAKATTAATTAGMHTCTSPPPFLWQNSQPPKIVDIRTLLANHKTNKRTKPPQGQRRLPKEQQHQESFHGWSTPAAFRRTLFSWNRNGSDDEQNTQNPSTASGDNPNTDLPPNNNNNNNDPRISHIVYTSGTTGTPKGCVSSVAALDHYLVQKNRVHGVSGTSRVLLASCLSFDPCFSDILATWTAGAALAVVPRKTLWFALARVVHDLRVTHVLATPTLWSTWSLCTRSSSSSTRKQRDPRKNNKNKLQTIALGGEPIPPRLRRLWARPRPSTITTPPPPAMAHNEKAQSGGPRLLATYGVTEACVYQAAGEIFQPEEEEEDEVTVTTRLGLGQNVGQPFPGLSIRICKEEEENNGGEGGLFKDIKSATYPENVGEVVLCGKQLDVLSSYLHQPDLSKDKFHCEKSALDGETRYHYRTGDRGYIHPDTGDLHILGRIKGEQGMVKINGVRVELKEVELAIIDDGSKENQLHPLVIDCLVVADQQTEHHQHESAVVKKLVAYIVLSDQAREELLANSDHEDVPETGTVCDGPLRAILRERCQQRARVVPKKFIIVPRVTVSPTGKRDARLLPDPADAVSWASLVVEENRRGVDDLQGVEALLADQIINYCITFPDKQKVAASNATSVGDLTSSVY